MNDVINRLVEESTDDVMGVPVLDKIRLANSIIDECISTINNRKIDDVHTDWEQGYNSALSKIASDLKIKFGVN